MRDPISRTLIAFVVCQGLFALLLPLVLIPPPEGLAVDLYLFGLRTSRDLVIEAAAASIILFTAVVWLQRRYDFTGFLVTVGMVGPALVVSPFFLHTGGVSRAGTGDKGATFFLGYLGLALVLGAIFWFLAVMERDDY